MARIEPIPPQDWPTEMSDALAALMPPAPRHPRPISEGRPKALTLLGTFAHHPALARAFFTFNGHLLMATTLSLRQREILILRVAMRRGCPYEWAQHQVVAGDVGLSDEEIGRVSWGPEAPYWDALDAALIRSVDELIDGGRITDETWTLLSGALDTQQLMDLVFTVGAYETLAWLLRSFATELDADLLRD